VAEEESLLGVGMLLKDSTKDLLSVIELLMLLVTTAEIDELCRESWEELGCFGSGKIDEDFTGPRYCHGMLSESGSTLVKPNTGLLDLGAGALGDKSGLLPLGVSTGLGGLAGPIYSHGNKLSEEGETVKPNLDVDGDFFRVGGCVVGRSCTEVCLV